MTINFQSLQQPSLHLVVTDEKTFGEYVYRIAFELRTECWVVRTVRGTKMRTRGGLFDEVSAAFQFPLYFGENWDALEECLGDLDWVAGSGYILFITSGLEVLSLEDTHQFDTFAKVLTSICNEWRQAKSPRPFHVVFHCNNDREMANLRQKLLEAGSGAEASDISPT